MCGVCPQGEERGNPLFSIRQRPKQGHIIIKSAKKKEEVCKGQIERNSRFKREIKNGHKMGRTDIYNESSSMFIFMSFYRDHVTERYIGYGDSWNTRNSDF